MIRIALLLALGLWSVGVVVAAISHIALMPVSHTEPVNPPDPVDAIICLGAGMASDTSPEAGRYSRGRAETCAALYREGRARRIIFTGYGHEFGSAAQGMADVAVAAGVPASAVIVEPHARSTIQNAAYSLPHLSPDAERIILVSDGFHLPRAWVIFRALGAPEIDLRATDLPLGQARRWIGREGVAIWFNLWRAGLYWGGGLLGIDPDRRIGWFD